DAIRVNEFIEEQVRRHPEQYFWVHKRYKHRGEDLPDVYA
ncbi:MAG: LpxL/LpxP family acyltransferase, partial [Verrucomicrobiia bacterium]